MAVADCPEVPDFHHFPEPDFQILPVVVLALTPVLTITTNHLHLALHLVFPDCYLLNQANGRYL